MSTIITARSQRCRICWRNLPLDAEHFNRHVRHANGFREVCRECRNRTRRENARERYGRAERTVILAIARSIRAGRFPAGYEELYRHAMSYFGGPRGLVQAMWKAAQAAPAGSQQTVSLLTAFWSLLLECSRAEERALTEYRQSLTTLSDDDVADQLIEGVRPILDSRGLEIVPKGSARG